MLKVDAVAFTREEKKKQKNIRPGGLENYNYFKIRPHWMKTLNLPCNLLDPFPVESCLSDTTLGGVGGIGEELVRSISGCRLGGAGGGGLAAVATV